MIYMINVVGSGVLSIKSGRKCGLRYGLIKHISNAL